MNHKHMYQLLESIADEFGDGKARITYISLIIKNEAGCCLDLNYKFPNPPEILNYLETQDAIEVNND